ncbi:MAG: hypothetical protein ACRBCS_12580 [Cellvibrionaceae bacterium]
MAIPVKLLDTQPRNLNIGGHPLEIRSGQIKQFQPFNTKTILRINNFVWANTPIQSGKTFLTSQGSRLVLEANSNRVIYIITQTNTANLHKVFFQPSNGFINDVISYPFEQAGRNLQATKKIAEYEIQILIGALSTLGWTGFLSVIGVDLFQFFINNKDKFSYYVDVVQACFKANSDLKQYAPTLRKKLIRSTIFIALEGSDLAVSNNGEIIGKLGEAAIEDPNIAGRGVGIIVSKLSINILDGRISVLSALWTVLLTFSTKAASALPGAVSNIKNEVQELSLNDKTKLANEILLLISRSDINLNKEEALLIADEISEHPTELKNIISQLSEAFSKN